VIWPFQHWRANKGARAEALNRLRNAAPIALPESYYEFLAFSDGGEGPLSKQPLYFQLDPVEVALKTFERGLRDVFFPGFVIIGSNGGGEYVAFDARGSAPWPTVSIDMTNTDLEESVWFIAATFDEFLALLE
jgi:hypothetical protein